MKLSDWARANGISYKTAWLWWKQGKLPTRFCARLYGRRSARRRAERAIRAAAQP